MSDSSAVPTPISVTNNAGWFSAVVNASVTPPIVTVTRLSDCLLTSAGCSTSFTVTAAGNKTATINVVNSTSSGGGGSSILGSSATSAALSAAYPNFAQTTMQITTSSATPIGVTASVTQGNAWLQVIQSASTVQSGTGITLTITAYSAGLPNNAQYTGQITVTPAGGLNGLTIPVTFTVGAAGTTGSLIPNPSSLAFAYPGGTVSAALLVNSSTAGSFNATTNASWLLINGATAVTANVGTTLFVSVNTIVAQSLATAGYSGTITLTNTLNAADVTTVPVTLSVNGGTGTGSGGSTGATAGPASLVFAYQVGRASPPCQTVLVPWSGNITVTPTGNFTSSGSFTGPGSILVCAAASGVTAGVYTGSINLLSTTGQSQSITATLNVFNQAVVEASIGNIYGNITCTYQPGVSSCNSYDLVVYSSDNSSIPITLTPSATWITVDGSATSTSGAYTVRLDPTGLANGTTNANISVSATGAGNGTLLIPVTVNVTGGTSSTGLLTLGASSLTFTGGAPGSQTLSVSATTTTNFTVSIPSSGCGWLSVSPSGALTTNQNLTVSVSSASLTTGQTYNCNISLTSGGITQTVPVTYTVGSGGGGGSTGSIAADKTSLTFNAQVGTNPTGQSVSITGVNGTSGVGYTAAVTGATWLTVSPSSGVTPGTLNVTVNISGLSNGAYTGYVDVTATNQLRIPVTLVISPATSISATPATLDFSYVAGNPAPATKQIQVAGSSANLTYSATVSSGSDWLSITPASGTAPAALDVKVNPGSLTPNTYTGTVVVGGTGTATGSTTITVTLTVTAPLPTINSVSNSASAGTGRIAPGEIISIFGAGLGPATPQTPPSGTTQYPTTLGNVQVTVGGYPAPLIYVSTGQINAVVPYEINRPFLASPNVIVKYLGQTSNGVTLPQVGATPGIFAVAGGTGQAAALNQNLSQNMASNPAAKGEVVVLYLTGEGQTSPAGVSGRVTPAVAPFAKPVSGDVTVTIDGLPATVDFFGAAPGIIAGVMQVNVRIPQGAGSGALPVVVRVGDVSTQVDARGVGTVTVAVR